MSLRKILCFGTFEVDNYGDLLFPHILASRFGEERACDLTFVSPKGGQANFLDAIPTIRCSEVAANGVHAVMLGGGNIVRETSTNLRLYRDDARLGLLAYPELYATATDIAAESGAPLFWNAPGVPIRFSAEGAAVLRQVCDHSAYISVRDSASANYLRLAGARQNISTVPDTAFEIPRVWTKDELAVEYETFKALFCVENSILVVHLNHRYFAEPLEVMAQRIQSIAAAIGAMPVLVAFGNCHVDGETARGVADFINVPFVLLDSPSSLKQITACIAHAKLYVGSSLHGFIVACAFGIKALVVADERRSLHRKFSGFLSHVELPSCLCPTWEMAEYAASRLDSVPGIDPVTRTRVNAALEGHWERIYAELDRPRVEKGKRTVNISANIEPEVDVVVCVHNARPSVEECLASIFESRTLPYNLILVDDASDAETFDYLRDVTRGRSNCDLIRSDERLWYTKAANMGLRRSKAQYVVLLNSDTIVPDRWLERLVACAQSSIDVGIVSAFSNAASWQSIPYRFDGSDWAVNEIPPHYTVAAIADLVSRVSAWKNPKLPFVNGFCMLVKRRLIDTIGYLDSDSFPFGYGEEIDYCLRARDAGMTCALADHAYVFHKKSKSYGHHQRRHFAAAAKSVLRDKNTAERLNHAKLELREHPVLEAMRDAIRNALAEGAPFLTPTSFRP